MEESRLRPGRGILHEARTLMNINNFHVSLIPFIVIRFKCCTFREQEQTSQIGSFHF